MEYCKALLKAIEEAPTEEDRAALQAMYDANCGGNQGQGGGNGNGPPGGLG